MFEIGCFLLKKKTPEKIQFLPVQLSILWFLCYGAQSCICGTLLLLQRVPASWVDWENPDGKITVGVSP